MRWAWYEGDWHVLKDPSGFVHTSRGSDGNWKIDIDLVGTLMVGRENPKAEPFRLVHSVFAPLQSFEDFARRVPIWAVESDIPRLNLDAIATTEELRKKWELIWSALRRKSLVQSMFTP